MKLKGKKGELNMKIVHLMSTNAFSGAENVACQIINLFKNEEQFNMVYVSEIKANKLNLDERNIDYYDLKKFNFKNVRKAIRDLRPDVIHAHDAKAIIMACFCSKNIKIVAHIHGNHENLRRFNLKTFLLNSIKNKIEKYVWVSESALKDFFYSKNIENKSTVVYNVVDGIELQKKTDLCCEKDSLYDIIFLGRLSYPKNPLRALEVISIISKKKKYLKVAFVGDGELREDFLKKIEYDKLGDVIDFYGFVNNPYKILKSSKILLMTSRYEGTPMSALEAIALGIPIVSTPTDGLVDIIKDGETGYISNDDKELAKKILLLISDEKVRKKMSNNVLEYSSKINNVDTYKNKLKKIYIEL